MLINNNFPNAKVDAEIRKFIGKKRAANTQASDSPVENAPSDEDITLFYRNQMTKEYKRDESNLRRVIRNSVKATDDTKRIKLIIYYRNKKLRNLIIRNNPNKPTEDFNVVYKYECNERSCKETNAFYIGMTTVTIKERFKQHASIKKHYATTHNRNITGSEMIRNVSVLAREREKKDLLILEALLIKDHNPPINRQCEDFNRVLKVFR